ncbi:hypothetical protein [Heyndrickxia oleronia]|jgi:CheY-like chemotaxis protein|uniref:hypothetical protein n=1 Tax=Heyndrickxia oleronia TaxID=38875 RepID=UPI00242EF336|nr:hypothetical protein [Heyndrickxia oleronia]MCI1589079.1 hypothetical protein [Heyndrickxia oleronia]MCI1611829.1 hypothetical protein [Heyndrickxia oleronia]MCI1743164.1 hypothetical protein [Heyndrickxia oleronia]MCI1759659.1 hypothetical protein [Heyndrickxia oleronia]
MIRAILVDDEKLALQLMERKLNDLGSVEVVRAFTDVESVIRELKDLDLRLHFWILN